jgi:amino acid permease
MLKDNQRQPHNLANGDEVEDISSYVEPTGSVEQRRKRAKIHFIFYTIGIYLAIVIVSIVVDNIESVFNIVGAICSTSISTLLPCFFYVKLIRLRKQPVTWKYYLAGLIFCVMTPYTMFSIVALYV